MLYGAIIGDIVGSRFEFTPKPENKDFELFHYSDAITDDTIMTCAIYDAISFIISKNITQDMFIKEVFANKLRYYGQLYPCPKGGYGTMFLSWLEHADKKPNYSCGNGSAMRVSSIGWLFNTLEEIEHYATLSAKVSHNHPEGVKGAVAIACSIFIARTTKDKNKVKEYIEDLGYKLRPCDEIPDLFEGKCQETIPICIEAFLEGNSYEDIIRKVISIGGDTDTNGCISGSLAEAIYPIPQEYITTCETYLDDKLLSIVKKANS